MGEVEFLDVKRLSLLRDYLFETLVHTVSFMIGYCKKRKGLSPLPLDDRFGILLKQSTDLLMEIHETAELSPRKIPKVEKLKRLKNLNIELIEADIHIARHILAHAEKHKIPLENKDALISLLEHASKVIEKINDKEFQ